MGLKTMKPIHYLIHRTYRFLSGFCDIIDGVCTIITLGFWCPNISFKFCILDSKFELYLLEHHEWMIR